MSMGQMPPAQESAPQEQSGGGAAKLAADANSNLMQLQEMLSSKFPEDAQKMAGVIQAFQAVIDGLGQPAGGAPQEESPGTGTTTPEAGAAKVQPAY